MNCSLCNKETDKNFSIDEKNGQNIQYPICDQCMKAFENVIQKNEQDFDESVAYLSDKMLGIEDKDGCLYNFVKEVVNNAKQETAQIENEEIMPIEIERDEVESIDNKQNFGQMCREKYENHIPLVLRIISAIIFVVGIVFSLTSAFQITTDMVGGNIFFGEGQLVKNIVFNVQVFVNVLMNYTVNAIVVFACSYIIENNSRNSK